MRQNRDSKNSKKTSAVSATTMRIKPGMAKSRSGVRVNRAKSSSRHVKAAFAQFKAERVPSTRRVIMRARLIFASLLDRADYGGVESSH